MTTGETTTKALARHGLSHREAGFGGRVITLDGVDIEYDGEPLKLTCTQANALVAALDRGIKLGAAILEVMNA